MNDYEQMIGSAVNSIIGVNTAKAAGEGGRWPMPTFKSASIVSFYTAPWTVRDFLEITDSFLSDRLSYADIAKKYDHPSRLARFLHLFWSRNLWNMDDNEREKVKGRVTKILRASYQSDPFCARGEYKPYAEDMIISDLNLTPDLVQKDTKYIQFSKRAAGLLWLLAETFAPRFHNVFYDFSGPYQINQKFFILKKFKNLRPEYLPFPFDYNFDEILVLDFYEKKPVVEFDIMNRMNLQEEAKLGSAIFLDGKPITDHKEIEEVINLLTKTLGSAVGYLNGMDKREMIIFNATMERYCILYPLVGKKALEIPKGLLDSIDNREAEQNRQKVVGKMAAIPKDEIGWRKLFDITNLL